MENLVPAAQVALCIMIPLVAIIYILAAVGVFDQKSKSK